jgi:Outer membrane protein beta-barrel domain
MLECEETRPPQARARRSLIPEARVIGKEILMRSLVPAVVAAAVLLGSAVPGRAEAPFEGNISFLLGLPQGEFADQVERNGYGIAGHGIYSFGGGPVGIGASIGYLVYGSETRQEPFSPSIPEVTVDVTTTNSILQGHLMMRVHRRTGRLRPYGDALLGFQYLGTETSIRDEDSPGEDIASSTNFDDTTVSYGLGGGLKILLYAPSSEPDEDEEAYEGEEAGEKENPLRGVFLDLGVRWLQGGQAQYLKEGSIRREGETLEYDVSESTTDLLTVHIGASLTFGKPRRPGVD